MAHRQHVPAFIGHTWRVIYRLCEQQGTNREQQEVRSDRTQDLAVIWLAATRRGARIRVRTNNEKPVTVAVLLDSFSGVRTLSLLPQPPAIDDDEMRRIAKTSNQRRAGNGYAHRGATKSLRSAKPSSGTVTFDCCPSGSTARR